MKVILCGYNWAGCKALQLLLESGHEVFVFTHDSPNYVHDLKGLCQRKGISFSTEKIGSKNLPFKPDILASIYYRYIISPDIINLVDGKIFNLHPSLLPEYRGCSSLTWALINGESQTGFSFHYIDCGIDTGNILLQKKIPIEDFDTQQSLYFKVMFEALKYFNEVLDRVMANEQGIPQLKGETGHYYPRGCPFNGVIDINWSIEMKERFIRAMIYPPMPAAKFNNREIFHLGDLTRNDD